MKVYLVGGAVRDELLGILARERDWCVVGSSPDELVSLGYKPVGKDFPVFLHPDSGEEYALARTERKTGSGYHGFTFHTDPAVTIEDDLERRDLTINAIAKDQNGQLIDPYGGRADIESRQLRHVSDAFTEDPLRVLRVARFAARFANLGFSVADETMTLMSRIAAGGELNSLVAERVWQETESALSTRDPQVFFEVLRACGALRILFPEIDALFGIPQPAKWHPEIDAGLHTMMVLEQAARLSDDNEVRFAALLHDLGKAVTDESLLPQHHGHERRSIELVQQFCDRLPVPNAYRELALLVAEFHGHCHRAYELKASTVLRLLGRCDAFRRPQRFEKFLIACEADARGRTGLENRDYGQADYLRAAFEAARQVPVESIAQSDMRGAEIGKALEKARLSALKAFKKAAQAPK